LSCSIPDHSVHGRVRKIEKTGEREERETGPRTKNRKNKSDREERQRGRETERQRDGETERRRDRETERQRDRETERQRDRDRGTEGLRERERETERQRQRQRHREQRHRDTDTQRHRDTETERQRIERQRDRETEERPKPLSSTVPSLSLSLSRLSPLPTAMRRICPMNQLSWTEISTSTPSTTQRGKEKPSLPLSPSLSLPSAVSPLSLSLWSPRSLVSSLAFWLSLGLPPVSRLVTLSRSLGLYPSPLLFVSHLVSSLSLSHLGALVSPLGLGSSRSLSLCLSLDSLLLSLSPLGSFNSPTERMWPVGFRCPKGTLPFCTGKGRPA